jgi:hypothetical protein
MATLDNDGTLWVEQPMYVQLAFERGAIAAPPLPLTQDGPAYSIGLWATAKGLSAEIQVRLLTVEPTVEFYDIV